MVGSIEPVEVNCSSSLDRCTRWKIYTAAPKVADSAFVTMALISSTPELNARNSDTNVNTPMSSAIGDRVAPWPHHTCLAICGPQPMLQPTGRS